MVEKEESWIHPEGSGIRIRMKVNASGTDPYGTSYQVDIPMKLSGGRRIRKQFKEKSEAEDFAEKQFEGSRKQGEAYFIATTRERNAFVNVLPELRDAGIDLEDAVRFALARMKPAGGDKLIREVVSEILEAKTNSFNRGNLSAQSVGTFKTRSTIITNEFGEILLKDLTLDSVKQWLMELKKSNRTLMNYMVCLGEIIHHGKRKGYVSENILDALSNTDRRELYGDKKEIQPGILSVEEAQRLLNAAFSNPELGLAGVVTLGLFCGLRTEELMKLEWDAVDLKQGFVTIGASIAKKRRLRNTNIPANAKAWLELIEDKDGKIVEARDRVHYFYLFDNLLREAGFVHSDKRKTKKRRVKTVWKKNAMRHSFGTYHFALHGDSIKTSNELGHRQGDSVLFAHYRALTTKEEAEKYFKICPAVHLD